MMKFGLLFGIFSFMVSVPNIASISSEIDGAYKTTAGAGQKVELRVLTLGLDTSNNAIVSAVVNFSAADGCSGGIAGTGIFNKNELILKPIEQLDEDALCSVSIQFADAGSKVTISENNCIAFHGAACALEGDQLLKVKSF